jgi:hypothetical protein
MKNKLLLTLLELHYHGQEMSIYYMDKTDKAGRSIYAQTRAENIAYWWAMCKTYGRKKTAKYIDDYKAMRDAKNI